MIRTTKKIWRKIAPKVILDYRKEKAKKRKILSNLDKSDLIFVHIPKTAGSSISTMIYGHDRVGHFTLTEYINIYGYDIIGKLTFCIVRDPYDRFVSTYNYLIGSPKNKTDVQFGQYIKDNFLDINDFIIRYFVKEGPSCYIHFKHQSDFILYNDIIEVDYIGKFENLDVFFNDLAKFIKTPKNLHLNKSVNKTQTNLSDRSKDIIAEIYNKDFMLLNYSK